MVFREFLPPNADVSRALPALLGKARSGGHWLQERVSGVYRRALSLQAEAAATAATVAGHGDGETIRHITEYVRHTVVGRAATRAAALVTVPADANQNSTAAALWHLEYCVERRLEQLRGAHDFRAQADPIEAVHDFRVATRSLRAYLDVFKPFVHEASVDAPQRALRRGTRALGGLREWDVHALELQQRLGAATDPMARAALEHVLGELERRRKRLRKRAAKKLAHIELRQLKRQVRQALVEVRQHADNSAGGARLIAWLTLEPALRAVAAANATCQGEDAEQLHALRILNKRLRYTLELFRPLLGESYAELYHTTKKAQELLGDYHDRVVLLEVLEAQRAKLCAAHQPTLAEGLASSIGAVEHEKRELFEKFRSSQHGSDVEHALGRARNALVPEF